MELRSFADATRWPWALAVVDYGRAMVAPSAVATGHFESALAHSARAARPYDEARIRLAYGEFLRRAQRRVDARIHLRLALETFADLHAEPMVARTTQELRASGETARKRDSAKLPALTPMQLKVAQLVGGGLSNKDVATQCWVSPRTVAFHLRNVFTKTGITSRGELASRSPVVTQRRRRPPPAHAHHRKGPDRMSEIGVRHRAARRPRRRNPVARPPLRVAAIGAGRGGGSPLRGRPALRCDRDRGRLRRRCRAGTHAGRPVRDRPLLRRSRGVARRRPCVLRGRIHPTGLP